MANLHPYLGFSGNASEAMAFYKDCLGGELMIQTVGESPAAAHMPTESHKNVMHAMLKNDSLILMGSDMMSGQPVHGNTISLALICKSKEEITTLFEKLSAGGKVGQALKEEFFGTFGDLTDKYGFRWMLQFDPNQK